MSNPDYAPASEPVWSVFSHQCSGCLTKYRSRSAADACELEHVDDQRALRGRRISE